MLHGDEGRARQCAWKQRAVLKTASSPPRAPALLMGIGLGGFIDGIVLHQILQWHHMLTGDAGGEPIDTVAGLEANTLIDGLFHLATWMFVATGMLLAGWGGFNLVEGLIDHQILGLHHVRDDLGAPLGWDLAFLALGALLILGGLALGRSGQRMAHDRDLQAPT